MWKTLLSLVLLLDLGVESFMTIGTLVAPKFMLNFLQFKQGGDMLLTVHFLAWCLLFFVGSLAVALYWVRTDNRRGWILALAQGVWLSLLGISVAYFFDRKEFLLLDTGRGLITGGLAAVGLSGLKLKQH
jgi:glucan phosphoethanolaminetransferase (alkaline phosphatase superfamily)